VRLGPWAAAVDERLGGGELLVEGLEVAEGRVAGRVEGCEASFAAELVPQRVWAAMWRFTRGNGPLELAAEGREQSEHLDLLLREDWDAPLLPERIDVRCACDGYVTCVHTRSLGRAFALEIERHPAALLRWRGATAERARVVREEEPDDAATLPPEAWEAGELPAPRPPRPLPPGAVLKRLGPSGIRVGGVDLAELLQPAYDAFGRIPNEAEKVSPGSSVSSPSPD
jgi:hypothetical protein